MADVLTELSRIALGPPHNFSRKTISVYGQWVRRLYQFTWKRISETKPADVAAFLTYVAEQRYSRTSQKQALCANPESYR